MKRCRKLTGVSRSRAAGNWRTLSSPPQSTDPSAERKTPLSPSWARPAPSTLLALPALRCRGLPARQALLCQAHDETWGGELSYSQIFPVKFRDIGKNVYAHVVVLPRGQRHSTNDTLMPAARLSSGVLTVQRTEVSLLFSPLLVCGSLLFLQVIFFLCVRFVQFAEESRHF